MFLPKSNAAFVVLMISAIILIALCSYLDVAYKYTVIPKQMLGVIDIGHSQKYLFDNFNSTNILINSTKKRKPVTIWLSWHNKKYLEDVLLKMPCFRKCVLKFEKVVNESHYSWNNSILWDAFIVQGNRIPSMVPPRRTSSEQVIIFHDTEPPLYIHWPRYRTKEWNGIFNWTMTYRRDSDIPIPYGSIVKRERNKPRKNYTSIFRKKSKKVAWIVSHCPTTSLREKYVNLLKKYVDIDIYGACDNNTFCPRNKGKECQNIIEEEYMFFLAFENNFCKDYITEKVYAWFNRNLILVTRGGANYSDFLPAETYIDAGNFESIEALGQFLNSLAKDEKRYINYLKRKDRYKSINSYRIDSKYYHQFYCKLCQRLQNVDKYRHSYPDMEQWLLKNASCVREREVKMIINRQSN